MIPIILKPFLHFLTSGLFGLLTYVVFLKIFPNLKSKERVALLFSLFSSILLHVTIDFGPGWF